MCPLIKDKMTQASSLPAPWAHLSLFLLSIAPLFVDVPANLNVLLMASITVYAGSWRSVKLEPPTEAMSRKDAMKSPIIASVLLFGLFLAFKFLPKELVNAILGLYVSVLGMLAITATVEPFIAPFVSKKLTEKKLEMKVPSIPLILTEGVEISATVLEILLGLVSGGFCIWYYQNKHFYANNALGLSISLQAVEHLSLGAVQHGVILLGGLFFYDIFWVFYTPVMVSVAKNFDAPIKLLFPRGLTDAGKPQFSMLGLGDIVIPGAFVAILLRYDAFARQRNSVDNVRPKFFVTAMFGYTAGLIATLVIMNVFKAAQPALLYLVPAILGSVGLHAWISGEFHALWNWQEEEEDDDGPSTPDHKKTQSVIDENERRVTRSATKKQK